MLCFPAVSANAQYVRSGTQICVSKFTKVECMYVRTIISTFETADQDQEDV